MVSFMTLQNSMDERKLKNDQAYVYPPLSLLRLCVCVRACVCACVCVREKWNG